MNGLLNTLKFAHKMFVDMKFIVAVSSTETTTSQELVLHCYNEFVSTKILWTNFNVFKNPSMFLYMLYWC